MARKRHSAATRHRIRFERQQSCRLVALSYILISMVSHKSYLDNNAYGHNENIDKSLRRKNAQFLKVATALVKSVRKEFKDYEEKS